MERLKTWYFKFGYILKWSVYSFFGYKDYVVSFRRNDDRMPPVRAAVATASSRQNAIKKAWNTLERKDRLENKSDWHVDEIDSEELFNWNYAVLEK